MATRFLMVEYPGHWPAEPLDVFAGEVRQVLAEAVRASGGQLLLVRRPDLRLLDAAAIRTEPHRWWLVDIATRTQTDGTWTSEADLAAAAAALTGPTTGTAPAGLTLLVCCHAKRDQCCAIDGRPLATGLAARWPEATWQCTHLHGHRFAPTFLMLPDGLCYGRAPAGLGQDVVADTLAGRLHLDLLRGHCAVPGWAQAAIVDVLAEVAALSSARTPTATPAMPSDPGLTTADVRDVASVSLAPDTWRVTLRVGSAPYERTVTAQRNAPVPLSCGDGPPKPSVTYLIQS